MLKANIEARIDYKRNERQKVQDEIDEIKYDMLYAIYMEGVNMSGEYHGCWVRFKDIENIVNRYIN